jgi:hypothetical protein
MVARMLANAPITHVDKTIIYTLYIYEFQSYRFS